MDEKFSGIGAAAAKSQGDARRLMERLFDVAQPGAVFGQPVSVGDYTVITASELKVGMGFGLGTGGGSSTERAHGAVEPEDGKSGTGLGGGGGGGGASSGRPVAAISVGPSGLKVEPVVDVTKVALAFFTTLGAMAMMLGRMRGTARRLDRG